MWRRGAVAYGALILVLTLSPGATAHEGWIHGCLVCGARGWADAVRNVVLFLPLGFMLARGWRAGAWTVLACLALTVGVEAVQTVVPGRDSSVGDILFNGAGGVLGLLAGGSVRFWWRPKGWRSRRLALSWLAAVVGALAALAWASGPSLAEGDLIGQWTPRPRGSVAYGGYLLDAEVAGHSIPAWFVPDGPAAERAWLSGAPVRVRFLVGPPPDGPSLLLRAVAATEEYLSIGVIGEDVGVRMRSRLADLRLHDPMARLPGVLGDVSPGDTATLSVWRDGDEYCAQVTGTTLPHEPRPRAEPRSGGGGDRAGPPGSEPSAEPVCGVALTVGRAWMAVIPSQALPAALWPVAEAVWLSLLAVPLGWWLGPTGGALLGAGGGVAALGAGYGSRLAVSLPEAAAMMVLAIIAGLARQHVEHALGRHREP